MIRIKYIKLGSFYGSKVQDIYGKEVTITISKYPPHKVQILKLDNTTLKDLIVRKFEQNSIQNAKRKVRKILKEEFEVNLGEEVRSKLCI